MRAAALRLGAVWPAGLTVVHEPDPKIAWPSLARALAGRHPQLTASPLVVEPVKDEAPVDRGGEILALAVARQLEQLHWKVRLLGFSAASLEVTAKKEKTKAASTRGGTARRSDASAPLELSLTGKGSFTVRPAEDLAHIKAHLVFLVIKSGRRATAELEIRRASTAKLLPRERLARAKREALAAFVEELFRRTSLEQQLVAAVVAR